MTDTRQAKSNRKTRDARRGAGLCIDCGCPADTYRCRACNDARNARRRIPPADFLSSPDPLEATRIALQRREAALADVDAIDWDAAQEAEAEALEAACTLDATGRLASPEAFCLAVRVSRHTLDDTVRRYGRGRAAGKCPRQHTRAWRAWVALQRCGDIRFRERGA